MFTIIRAYSGNGAISSPTSVATLPSTAVKQVANDSVAHGELIMTGNWSETKTVTMTKQATASSTRLRGF